MLPVRSRPSAGVRSPSDWRGSRQADRPDARPASWLSSGRATSRPPSAYRIGPPAVCPPPTGMPTACRARRDTGVCPAVPPAALRSRGMSPLARGPPPVPASAPGPCPRKTLPPAPSSDTVLIVCRPAVRFNPIYPARPRPRLWSSHARCPPVYRSFVRGGRKSDCTLADDPV